MTREPDQDENDSDGIEKLQIEIWKKAVETQMHFNEMSAKSRQLGLSFVVGALALAFILLSRQQDFSIDLKNIFGYSLKLHISGILVLISALGLHAVKRLDLNVYHRMLRGAVTFGEQLEKETLRDKLMRTPKGMTEFISLYSRYKSIDSDTFEPKGRPKSAERKLRSFYNFTIIVLLIMGGALTYVSSSLSPINAMGKSSQITIGKTADKGKKATRERVEQKIK